VSGWSFILRGLRLSLRRVVRRVVLADLVTWRLVVHSSRPADLVRSAPPSLRAVSLALMELGDSSGFGASAVAAQSGP
jgi:hypothetical protein